MPHEEHGVYKDPANEELRRKRDEATAHDAQAFMDKWGASGAEMEKRALRQLVGEST